jgi:ferredoxin hydrogenase large subunit/hydrogenase large subunit
LTRIEGHLAVHAHTETEGDKHRIKDARCEGEMFRGLEQILVGRDPLDAQQIMQRVCGVCPIAHGTGAVRALEDAFKLRPNTNGRLLQNLIFAANYLHSHILHFYQLAGLDFVDVTAVLKYSGRDRTLRGLKAWAEQALGQQDLLPAAPLLPRYEGDYIQDLERNFALLAHYAEALEVRRTCDEMGAVFGARLPHSTALVPGGCTQVPTLDRVLAYRSRLDRVLAFIEEVYLPDLLEVAKEFPQYFTIGAGYGNFLSYGVFELDNAGGRFFGPGVLIDGTWEALQPAQITEEATYAWYADANPVHPSAGSTKPSPDKSGAYSWIKAPRYRGKPLEVGPLARVMVNYHAPGSWVKQAVDEFITPLALTPDKLVSVLGRHVARGVESLWLARRAQAWLDEIEVDGPASVDFTLPATGNGMGLTEAPRGALGHWLAIQDYRISHYQAIVPTTWNCSPRDATGQPGPVEKALEGVPVANPEQPIEAGRVVRSFDPCIACAVH